MKGRAELISNKPKYYPLRGVDVLAVVLFWTFLAFISTAGRELDPRIPDIPPRIVSAVIAATHVEYALWAVITLPVLWLASRYSIEGGRRWGRVLLLTVLGIVIAIAIDSLLFTVREGLLSSFARGRRRAPSAAIGLGFLDDLMVYFAVLGAGVARDYFLRYRSGLQETVQLQAQLAQARLDALRSQLNPHFLFNTLNAVSALVERDPRGSRKMIARLSDLLRYTLDETRQEVPLRRELEMISEYVELMQIRFQGKLRVTTQLADGVADALVPNLILQPLVENAIKYGVDSTSGAGEIVVAARRNGDELVVTISDSGPGPGEGEGVGLSNTSNRLRVMYGAGARVTLTSSASGRGTVAEVGLPFHTAPIVRGVT